MPRVLGILSRNPEGRWAVEFPDLPGCEVSAASVAQLRETALGALQAAFRERRLKGEPPPPLTDYDKFVRHPLAQRAMMLSVDLP